MTCDFFFAFYWEVNVLSFLITKVMSLIESTLLMCLIRLAEVVLKELENYVKY